jgi:STE24 endopeptidase
MWLILIIYVVMQLFRYLLDWLNIRHMRGQSCIIPAEFESTVDASLLRKSQDYLVDQTKLAAAESVFMNVVIVVFFFGGLLDLYSSWIAALDFPSLAAGWVFFILLCFAEQVLAIPFNLISVFRLERRYGFTTTTPRLWLLDLVKETIISGVIFSLLVFSGLWLISRSPGYWWLWFWILLFSFSIIITYISPWVIEPLFNKFTPLEENSLKESIIALARKAGISARKVLKMDASRRSKHSNAYFTGLGKAKRVVLFDTLLEGMNHGEILAVLAHEIGHWKRHHVLKSLVMFQALSLAGLYLVFRLTETGFLTALFRVEADSFFSRVLLAVFLVSMLVFLLRPVITAVTRSMEREADRLSFELTGESSTMVSALVKLSKDNLSNLYPHPLYVIFHYSHPPVVERIRALREAQQAGSRVRVVQ